NRNPLVLDHAEQSLRPRAGKRLADGAKDAQPVERLLQISKPLRPVSAKKIMAEEPAARLVLEKQNSTRGQDAQHFRYHPPPAPAVMQRRADIDDVELFVLVRQLMKVAGDANRAVGCESLLAREAATQSQCAWRNVEQIGARTETFAQHVA